MKSIFVTLTLMSTLMSYSNCLSAWTLIGNKTVWMKISINGVSEMKFLAIDLFPEILPNAVNNFVQLCNSYNGKMGKSCEFTNYSNNRCKQTTQL